MTPAPRPAVFLDRDGTLNRELEGALTRVADLELLGGALEGAARLARAGFALVVVSNQSAVAAPVVVHVITRLAPAPGIEDRHHAVAPFAQPPHRGGGLREMRGVKGKHAEARHVVDIDPETVAR